MVAGVERGDVCWADFGEPRGSQVGFRRPVVVLQSDAVNRSSLRTVVVVPLTGVLRWGSSPGSVLLTADETGLDVDSIARLVHVTHIDRVDLDEPVGRLPRRRVDDLLDALDLVLDR